MKRDQRILLATTLVTVLTLAGVQAQTTAQVPRLVVTIVVDQLRSDYLEAFSPLFHQGGFKRLMQEGRVYHSAVYPISDPDRASAIATLYTGTVPYDHGIVGEKWLDRSTLRPVYCVDDENSKGIQTTETGSPKYLGVSTIQDELKIATQGRSVVYSIAPYRDAAILQAGHASDGAYWINDQTGEWCTSSFYGTGISPFVRYANSDNKLKDDLKKLVYEPYNEAVGTFNYFVSGGMREPFKHKFSKDAPIVEYKSTALVNETVNRLATSCINTSGMGIDEVTDFLSLTYYAGNYNHQSASVMPMELQDCYVRLDNCLENLLNTIDEKVGLKNTIVVLTSTGYAEEEQIDASRWKIPQGKFYINRTARLLNMYYMAMYGQGEYVEGAYNNQIYLNHKLFEEKQLNLVVAMDLAQEFLLQCSGVKDVYTAQRLTLGAWTPGISRIRNGYNPKCSGDIYVEVAPGWELLNEEFNTSRPIRASFHEFPLIFLGYDIKPERLYVETSVDVVAPTLAHFMRIRAPNACSVAPLTDIRKR